jgi:zinc transport system permease protein
MISLADFFVQLQQNVFLQHACLALLLLAPLCAMLGLQVVNFRLAFYSDAISHSAFSGIALGVLFHVDPRLAIIVFGLLIGVSITYVRRSTSLALDTVIGVFNSAIIAFGIAVISARKGMTRDFQSFLYGDVLSVHPKELWMLSILLLVVLLYSFFNSNRLLAISLHEELALTNGIRVKLQTYIINLLLALVVAMGIRAVGILLITALLVVPAATARNLAHNSRQMFWWNMLMSISASFIGIVIAVQYDTTTGATIILVGTIFFLCSAIWAAIVKTKN